MDGQDERCESPEAWLRRLRWRCRRGLLEVDLILGRFADREIERLEEGELGALEVLLDLPDATLLDWLLGRSRPDERDLADVVDRIRSTAAT